MASSWRQDEAKDLLAKTNKLSWERARTARNRGPHPFVTDEAKAGNEADSRRREIDLRGDPLHLESNEIVREANCPELLHHPFVLRLRMVSSRASMSVFTSS